MAAPNILEPTSILGKTATLALTTSAQTLLNNAASSGKVLKVTSLYVANIDGVNAADATVRFYPQASIGGTAVAIANTVAVPADATLVVITKDAPIYLEEDRSLGALASANSDLVAVISYEEIS